MDTEIKQTDQVPKNPLTSSEQGFTIIEILVAIAIIGVLTVVLSSTLIGTLGLNRDSQLQLDSATAAQQVMENIKGNWNTADDVNYDRVCAAIILPTGSTAKFINLDSRGKPLVLNDSGTPIKTSGCPSQPLNLVPSTMQPPVMRRVIATAGTGSQATTLTLDVVR